MFRFIAGDESFGNFFLFFLKGQREIKDILKIGEMGNWRKRASAIFILLFALVWGDVIYATHEVDHRYTIFGSVRDESGRPLPDTRVIVTDTRLGDGLTTFSRKDGSYEVTLHLHNENLGDEVVVSAHGEEKRIKATFDPSDKFAERRQRVDFGVEQAEAKEGQWIYYSIGIVLLTGALVYMGVFRKRSGKGKKGVVGQRGRKGRRNN